MTAPDPTAGEVWTDADIVYAHPASPPAVAASTGTSEDVEALAELIWHNTDEPMWSAMVLAKQFLASDWLAAHDAATADRVRRETAEGIAQALENAVGYRGPNSATDYGKGYNAGHQDRAAMDVRLAREQAR